MLKAYTSQFAGYQSRNLHLGFGWANMLFSLDTDTARLAGSVLWTLRVSFYVNILRSARLWDIIIERNLDSRQSLVRRISRWLTPTCRVNTITISTPTGSVGLPSWSFTVGSVCETVSR